MGQLVSKLITKPISQETLIIKKEQDFMSDTTYLPESSANPTTLHSKRDFHTEETSTYWLPKDDEEQHRLTGVSDLFACRIY